MKGGIEMRTLGLLCILTICVVGGCQTHKVPQATVTVPVFPAPETVVVPQFKGHLYYVTGEPGANVIQCWDGISSQEFFKSSRILSVNGQTAGCLIVNEGGYRLLAININTRQVRVLGEAGRDVEALEVLRIRGNMVEWRSAANWRGTKSYNLTYDLVTGEKHKLPMKNFDLQESPDGSWTVSIKFLGPNESSWVGSTLFYIPPTSGGEQCQIKKVTASKEIVFASFPTETGKEYLVKRLAVSPDQNWAAVELDYFSGPDQIYLVPAGAEKEAKVIQGRSPCLTN